MEGKKLKIFVTGFFNAGKTTLIHTLDDKAISVETKLAEEYEPGKTHTTTGFDLGRLVWARPNLNKETEGVIMSKVEYLRDKNEYIGWHVLDFEIKGSPGQIQFKTVRKVLAKGSDGVLMLIDGCDLGNIGNAMAILEEVRISLEKNIPLKIIANKSDREDYNGGELISTMIGENVYEGSAKNNIGIKDAIIEILKTIINDSDEVKLRGEAVA
ncbi:MAG: hypothetical protein ACFFAK_08165 [Promethearchaeota archaeon]